jgi:Uncharacterized conserved protein
VESSPIIPRFQNKLLFQLSQRTPDHKIMHCSTEPDEISDLEHLRYELIEENERLKNQELRVRQIFDKLREDSSKIKEERIELRKSKEIFQQREEIILFTKKNLEKEKDVINQEKIELDQLKKSLNDEYMKLKQEKLKVLAHKKCKKEVKSKSCKDSKN